MARVCPGKEAMIVSRVSDTGKPHITKRFAENHRTPLGENMTAAAGPCRDYGLLLTQFFTLAALPNVILFHEPRLRTVILEDLREVMDRVSLIF